MADQKTEVVILGAGPGGYSAAFRAADLGKKVTLVERYSTLGGVCLNVGCIPSKALLHIAKVIDDVQHIQTCGISFGEPQFDQAKLVAWKNKVIGRLTTGLAAMAKQRKVSVVQGVGEFMDPHTMKVVTDQGAITIGFEQAVIAAGSVPVKLPFLPDDKRIVDSTGALELENYHGNLLVIGGGIIGLEMATVYRALGSKITIVELLENLMAGADKDLAKVYQKYVSSQYENIWLETKVTKVEAKKEGLWVTFEGKNAPAEPKRFDKILSAVGRTPNGLKIAADKAGVNVDQRGFIPVDKQMRTNVPHIFAIGDIVGQPMLAHKAVAEGRVAAEVIAGKKHYFEPKCIPSVAYTDPEVAWAGVTETEAKAKHIAYETGVFPWMASGRSLSMGRDEGFTKLIFDSATQKVIGAGIIGPNAGELIAEVCLAIEMGCDAEDIALTVHPHPTLSESVALAAEMFEGTITDLPAPKKRQQKE
jgi:dihydrolipoamide dehydrogenase